MIEKANGSSLRSIGRLLGRSASTIGRELRRQPPHARGYDAGSAGRRYLQQRQQCRRRKRLAEGS
ncbi:MAG: helix-turn-helix domain-containing protein, partial [Xanthomonadaceae bacterium]|nr:helix-turn-helix domain-containing protein [Xanthomonadaceae bacterium]